MRSRLFMILVAALVCGAGVPASADIVTLAPSQRVVLSGANGDAQVALLFDLSRLSGTGGRTIHEAVLEWPLTTIPTDRFTTYSALALLAGWSEASVASEVTLGITEESPVAASWDMTPEDLEANEGVGLIRLDVTKLVSEWHAGSAPNYGVLIRTPDVQAQSLRDALNDVRLTVFCGPRGR